MKHIIKFDNFLCEKKNILTNDFWELVNNIADELKKSSNFMPYWELEEKYPEFEGLKGDIHDKICVPLHNKNKVKASISINQKIVMWLCCWREINKLKDINIETSFKEWFYNAELIVYRGIPSPYFREPKLEYSEGFISTTLNFDTAMRFTQSGWAGRSWVNKDDRNGYIIIGTIKPCDVHIFNNLSDEYECVIKAPYAFNEKGKVIKNEFIIE